MATKPTPEQSGRQILAIYEAQGTRPGEMILLQALQTSFLTGSRRGEDFNQGLKWLVDQGFVEEKAGQRFMYFLTDPGFAEI